MRSASYRDALPSSVIEEIEGEMIRSGIPPDCVKYLIQVNYEMGTYDRRVAIRLRDDSSE